MHPFTAGVFELPARETLLDGVLRWLTSNIHRFDLPVETAVADRTPETISQGRARKAFGELGAALRIVDRVAGLRDRPDVLSLKRQWLRIAHDSDIFFDAARRTRLFPGMAVAHAVIGQLSGTACDDRRRSLQRVLDQGFMDRVERCAWHKLDLKYYFEAGGLAHAFASDGALLAESSLLSPPALPWSTSMDLYGVTHLIFHFTDFGVHALPSAAGFDASRLRRYVSLALSMSLCERDFDLSAELLMCLICLGGPVDALERAAARSLCDAQQPEGFMPDRRWQAGLADGPADERETELFYAVYHPTLVTLFLIACDALHPRCGADRVEAAGAAA